MRSYGRARAAAAMTCAMIGLPWKGASTFPGNLFELIRAWTNTLTIDRRITQDTGQGIYGVRAVREPLLRRFKAQLGEPDYLLEPRRGTWCPPPPGFRR